VEDPRALARFMVHQSTMTRAAQDAAGAVSGPDNFEEA
jgi:hypothetical protein